MSEYTRARETEMLIKTDPLLNKYKEYAYKYAQKTGEIKTPYDEHIEMRIKQIITFSLIDIPNLLS